MIAVYLRCSSAKQDNASQAHAIREHLRDRSLLTPEIESALARVSEDRGVNAVKAGRVHVYADWARTGKPEALHRRKGWGEFFRNHPDYDELIVFAMDRIVRGMDKQIQLNAVLAFSGCKVCSITSAQTTDNLTNHILRTVEAWKGEQETKTNSRRITEGLRATKERNAAVYRAHLDGMDHSAIMAKWAIKPDMLDKIISCKGGWTHCEARAERESQDREMYDMWTTGEHKAEEIADRFGVSLSTFWRAVQRWKKTMGVPRNERVGGASVPGPLRKRKLKEASERMKAWHAEGKR